MESSESSAKPKSRLGRGLSSLISVSTPEAPAEAPAVSAGGTTPLLIPISKIVPNPYQPRRAFNETSIQELAASLKSTGLIQPVVVRQVGAAYQLIAGERRLRAAKVAGLTELPAIVRDVDALTQAQMALIENIQREDLNPMDRAAGYRTLLNQLGLTQAELAGRLGEDRSTIANYLRLMELDERVQELVRSGALPLGHAKLIAGVTDPATQVRLAETVVGQGLSVRNLERLIENERNPALQTGRPKREASPHVKDLEKSITRQLGMRASLRQTSAAKGKLTIHYSSLDQFDELLEKLGVRVED